MKKILGLDLGTNSIGWALIDNEQKKILGMGSRIIPMGTDKQDYEKGVGITKNADRRTKRTIRKMNKRYKLRRNKLLYILHELGMLPYQFQFKELNEKDNKGRFLRLVGTKENELFQEKNNGIPVPIKLEELELLPVKKGTLQLDSLAHYTLRAKAIKENVELKELGKILYSYNQLRGYAGGNSDDDTKKKKEDDNDENESVKKYEVFNQKVTIKEVKQSEIKFQGRGKNKGQEFNKFDITVSFDDEELEGETELQNLKEKEGQEEELEIRIKRNKEGETTSIVFALPQKTNWRKQMEKTEEDIKQGNLHVSQLILQDLEQNKWAKIRNRVFLRNRYQAEFDAVWETQSNAHNFLKNCPQETIEKIANYLFPGTSESQKQLREAAIKGGLKYIIKEQVIYYQRPLKQQKELISKCQFEKDEQVLANSHPLFQEFRCWDQINRMFITSKQEVWNEKKKKNVLQYTDRFLTNDEKQKIYEKLQTQKQLGFSEVTKIVNLKNDKTEYLNGLNPKAKLKGCDTQITIKKILGEYFETLFKNDINIVEKIWKAIYDNANNGSEYDPRSIKVSSIKDVLKSLNDETASELALKFAQTIKFPRKYASLSAKAIQNILPLMQLNPSNVSDEIKTKFENIKNLVETGEIVNDIDNNLEDYVISFVQNNPKAIETGGLMYAFASSLVYGKHTAEKIKAQIKDYHEITYNDKIKEERKKLRNPIVEQISNETMQVIKAIWKQHKFNPEELEIRVELARDLKNSAAERDKIWKGQRKNEDTNKKIKDTLQSEGIPITDRNVLKYKLYVQQNFISPYTQNKIIPLSALFDDKLYDIDHIIPKSRYFDDSISNKVVCETNINEEKSNRTAWEYISQQNSKFEIRSVANYIKHINDIFYGKKKKNLLLEKIPTNPVERQLKNTQYITVAVKNELAKVVGSDNVKTSTGEVTDFLRSRWGLKKLFMELTESRFKQMELWDLDENGNPKSEWVKRYVDGNGKNKYEIRNWSKRYDHRHHAIDALVVALTEQSHIQRLNNLNKYLQDELTNRKEEFKLEVKEDENILEVFFNLEEKRREEIQKQIESSRYFEKPFEDLVRQAKEYLETMIISIKPKDKLGIKKDDSGNTQLKIRGALHQETNYGKTKDPKTSLLRDTKTVGISILKAKDISQIIDEVLKKEIDTHRKKYESMKEAFTGEGLKAFNENRFQRKKPTELKPPVYKIKIWYSAKEDEGSTLQRLYDKNEKLSVVTGDNYLFLVVEKEDKNGKERIFDIVSLYDSVFIANRTLKEKKENYRVIIVSEKLELMKSQLKTELEKNRKKLGDKLSKETSKKKKEELQKKIEQIDDDFKLTLLFTLQQNELVYLPEKSDEDIFSNINNIETKKKLVNRIYKAVKFDKSQTAHFVPHNYANVISIAKNLSKTQKDELQKQYGEKKIPKKDLNFVEYGSYRDCSPYPVGEIFIKNLTTTNKNKKIELKKIQETCIKLKIDWLGNISPFSNTKFYPTTSHQPDEAKEGVSYFKTAKISTLQQSEERMLLHTSNMNPEERMAYLQQLRETTQNSNLSEDEKISILSKFKINPTDENS